MNSTSPIEGTLDLSIDVTAPKNLLAQSEGSLAITCDGCAVGDGKAKLTLAALGKSQSVTIHYGGDHTFRPATLTYHLPVGF